MPTLSLIFRQIARFQSCLPLLLSLNNSGGCHAITQYAAINSKIISPSYRLHTLSIWAWDREMHDSSGIPLCLFFMLHRAHSPSTDHGHRHHVSVIAGAAGGELSELDGSYLLNLATMLFV